MIRVDASKGEVRDAFGVHGCIDQDGEEEDTLVNGRHGLACA